MSYKIELEEEGKLKYNTYWSGHTTGTAAWGQQTVFAGVSQVTLGTIFACWSVLPLSQSPRRALARARR
jgi:hypothetical protein